MPIKAIPIFAALFSLHPFYLKITTLPFLMLFGILTYLSLLRVSHLISRNDLEFIHEMTPPSLHRYLRLLARIVGVMD
jgi:hypothetical protein